MTDEMLQREKVNEETGKSASAKKIQSENKGEIFLQEKLEILTGQTEDGQEPNIEFVEIVKDSTRGKTTLLPLMQVPFYKHESLGISKISIPCNRISELCYCISSTCPQITEVFEKLARSFPNEMKTMRQLGVSAAKMFETNIELLSNARKFRNIVIYEPIFVEKFIYCRKNLILTMGQLIFICEVLCTSFLDMSQMISKRVKLSSTALILSEDLQQSHEILRSIMEELKNAGKLLEETRLDEIQTRKLDCSNELNSPRHIYGKFFFNKVIVNITLIIFAIAFVMFI